MRLILSLTLLWSFSVKAASPFIWGSDNMAENLASKGLYFSDLKQIITVTANPSSGLAAPIGSLALMNDSGAGRVFVKVGASDTAWTDLLSAISGWSLIGNSGTNPSSNFFGTVDAQDLVLRTNNTERFRITSAGSYDTTLGLGIVHSDGSGLLSSSAIVNADVDASAAIAGTKIDPDFGAQNIESTGDLLVSDATISGLANGIVKSSTGLLSGGNSVNLTSEVSNVLPIANGGTNKALTLSAGGVPYFDADSFEVLAAGTSGFVLQSQGASAPVWTNPATLDSATDLQKAYDNSFNGVIDLDGTRNGIALLNNSVTGDLFRVANSGNTVPYFQVSAAGIQTTDAYITSLTSGRVALVGASSVLTDSSDLTFGSSILTNTGATSPVYRLTKTGTGAGSFEISYFGTAAGAFLNGASLTNPIFVGQGGVVQTQFQTDGNVRLYKSLLLQETGGGSEFSAIKAPAAITTSYTITLPAAAPTTGQILRDTDGAGTLAWESQRYVNDFTTNDIIMTSSMNQTWRYIGTDLLFDNFDTTAAIDGARITIINENTFNLEIPFNATGIVYQNGTRNLGQYQSITYEFISGVGLVEVN